MAKNISHWKFPVNNVEKLKPVEIIARATTASICQLRFLRTRYISGPRYSINEFSAMNGLGSSIISLAQTAWLPMAVTATSVIAPKINGMAMAKIPPRLCLADGAFGLLKFVGYHTWSKRR